MGLEGEEQPAALRRNCWRIAPWSLLHLTHYDAVELKIFIMSQSRRKSDQAGKFVNNNCASGVQDIFVFGIEYLPFTNHD